MGKKQSEGPLSKRDAKSALERLTGQIRALQRDVDRNFWQIGRRLEQVSTLELHLAAGHASVADYAQKELGLSRSQALAYMRVAGAFSEGTAVAHGVAKLERGLRYLAQTPEDDRPEDLPELRVRVPGPDGATIEKAFAECTSAELAAATRAAAAPAGPPRRVSRAVAAAEKAIDEVVGEEAARAAEVSARRAGDEVLIDVRGVPFARARKVMAALAKIFPKA